MRMIRKGLALILVLCMLLAAAAAGAETYIEMNGTVPDQMSYPGNWKTAYSQILYNHKESICAYENRIISFYHNGREYNVPCRPVKTQDINGDGIPELLFLEAAAEETRGDLYIYSSSGTAAKCVLYVPGITRLDYDELLGFDIYMSTYGGNTLVIEHYEGEYEWKLQFGVSSTADYYLLTWMKVEGDYSGEGYDSYYRNGMIVGYQTYQSALNGLRNGKYNVISEYMKADYSSYGLDLTWQGAVDSLGGNSGWQDDEYDRVIYGWTIDKLATRKGPGTQYEGGGTYSVKNQYIQVLAKAYDKRNKIWWVKCVIPYHGEERILWTGYKRFDENTLSLDDLPEEVW